MLTLQQRARQIIVALALSGTPMRGEDLALRVWPDRDPSQMQNALRVHIAAIRKASDASAIVYEQGYYHVTKSRVIDLNIAETLVRQASKSVPLGLALRRSLEETAERIQGRLCAWDVFEWFAPVGRRANTVWRTAVLTLASDALHRRDAATALEFAAALIERDPCDERARRIAIHAHLQSGDQAEAVREYRECRRALREDLGVDISAGDGDQALQTFIAAIA